MSSDQGARSPSDGGHLGARIMKIAGIEVRLHYSWLVIFILVLWTLSAGYLPTSRPGYPPQAYWAAGAAATFLFFLSVLIHEFCHSLLAKRIGLEVTDITLFIFGGVSRSPSEFKDPKIELAVAAVGPLSSFVLSGLFWLLWRAHPNPQDSLSAAVLSYVASINLALAVFNLIPGFPLDGGRVLRSLVWWKTGSLSRATRAATAVGKGFSLLLLVFGGMQVLGGSLIAGLWSLLIGMFLMGAAESGYRETVVRQFVAGMKVRDVMVEDVVTVPAGLSVRELIGRYFLHYGYKGFPVVEDDRVAGMVFLRFVKDVPEAEQGTTSVRQVMSDLDERLVTSPDTPLDEALRKMGPGGAARLVVLDGDRLTGLITKSGVFRLMEVKRILEH
ncbi:MAG: site-2 protease family protein [Deltaproteobacteria bacterium]|nr:site-2 protease family protein [Deltaproteobacteria bacterium]